MTESKKRIAAELAVDLDRLQRLVDERDLNAAQALADSCGLKAKQAGITSAFFLWLKAVLADRSGEFVLALKLIGEALEMDPLCPPHRHSHEVVVRNVRAALHDPARAADEPNTPELWTLLVQAGEADDGCHLALARYRLVKDNALDALRLVDAVTTLSPTNREAWALKAVAARSLGDHKLAARAEAEAIALGEGPVLFATQPMAQG